MLQLFHLNLMGPFYFKKLYLNNKFCYSLDLLLSKLLIFLLVFNSHFSFPILSKITNSNLDQFDY